MSKKNKPINEVESTFEELINTVSCMSRQQIESVFDASPLNRGASPKSRVIGAAGKALVNRLRARVPLPCIQSQRVIKARKIISGCKLDLHFKTGMGGVVFNGETLVQNTTKVGVELVRIYPTITQDGASRGRTKG